MRGLVLLGLGVVVIFRREIIGLYAFGDIDFRWFRSFLDRKNLAANTLRTRRLRP